MSAKAKALLAEADKMLDEHPTHGWVKEENDEDDLGESDSVTTNSVAVAREKASSTGGAGSGSGSGYTRWTMASTIPGVGKIPNTSLKSSGKISVSSGGAGGAGSGAGGAARLGESAGSAAGGTKYKSLNNLVTEVLRGRNKQATADYLGPIKGAMGSAGQFNHLWRKQYQHVTCMMKASINMDVCWDPKPLVKHSTTPGAIGSVGMGGHHSAACDPIIKLAWNTQLWHNVSEYEIDSTAKFNVAFTPPGQKKKVQNFDKQLTTCKIWYTNIEAPLEQLLSTIRHKQTLCALDSTMFDRDRDCYRVVQIANAGKAGTPQNNTQAVSPSLDAATGTAGAALRDSATGAANDALTELSDEEESEASAVLGEAMFHQVQRDVDV
jgi:hypothetical protein